MNPRKLDLNERAGPLIRQRRHWEPREVKGLAAGHTAGSNMHTLSSPAHPPQLEHIPSIWIRRSEPSLAVPAKQHLCERGAVGTR